MAMLFALILRCAIALSVRGYAVDINCFEAWAYRMLHTGPLEFYSDPNYFCDYPPVYLLLLWPMEALRTAFGIAYDSNAHWLMIKLAPALMRAAKKTSRIEPRLKKIISLVSQIGYGKIEERDLEIAWHSGIPTTESVRADIAAKHLATGWSRKRVLMLDYGLSEEEAEAEIAQKEAEAPPIPQSGYGAAEDGESDDE